LTTYSTSTSHCSSGCPTPGAHDSWGSCVKAKNTGVAWAQSASGLDRTNEKYKANAIKEARAALKQGIKPDTTRLQDVRRAVAWSNEHGKPYVSST
jgi:hypothetical protein